MLRRSDELLGARLHSFAREHAALRHAAAALSLTADEVVWFGLTGAFISSSFAVSALRGLATGAVPPADCVEQCVSDCFGTMCLAGVVEVLLKLVFRRSRPLYAPQKSSYSLPGEQYSMPSGHSLRSGVIAVWLRNNHHAELMCSTVGIPRPSMLAATLWAFAVAVSRVIKGKVSTLPLLHRLASCSCDTRVLNRCQHFPLDCMMGVLLGLVVASAIEQPVLLGHTVHRGWLKVACGIFITACWGPMMLLPLHGKAVSRVRALLLMLVYFSFYAFMLVCRIPELFEEWDWWPGKCGDSVFENSK